MNRPQQTTERKIKSLEYSIKTLAERFYLARQFQRKAILQGISGLIDFNVYLGS